VTNVQDRKAVNHVQKMQASRRRVLLVNRASRVKHAHRVQSALNVWNAQSETISRKPPTRQTVILNLNAAVAVDVAVAVAVSAPTVPYL
jgi:hypothetical protein